MSIVGAWVTTSLSLLSTHCLLILSDWYYYSSHGDNRCHPGSTLNGYDGTFVLCGSNIWIGMKWFRVLFYGWCLAKYLCNELVMCVKISFDAQV